MTLGRFVWIASAAIIVMILNIAISFVWVWVYATFIDKGHDNEYYEEYAQRSAPHSSMVAGFPLMVGAAFFLGSLWEPEFAMTAALTMWLVYTVLDVAIVALSKPEAKFWRIVVISQAIKLGGAVMGAMLAGA